MAGDAQREPVRMCGRCGGEMIAYGALYAAVRISFRPQDAKFMTLETGEIMTKAIMCGDCGSIEIIGDANKLRRLTSAPRKADSAEG
jgi:ribosomal protein S27AE